MNRAARLGAVQCKRRAARFDTNGGLVAGGGWGLTLRRRDASGLSQLGVGESVAHECFLVAGARGGGMVLTKEGVEMPVGRNARVKL